MTGKILITRPYAQSQLYARELEEFGFSCLIEPMMEIELLAYDMPDMAKYQGLIFTSSNAVRDIAGRIEDKSLPVFCVGGQTAYSAKAAGFQNVLSADGAAEDLLKLVSNEVEKGQALLHVRGYHTALPIHIMLKEQGIGVDLLTVYKAEHVEDFSEACKNAIKNDEIAMVPFFSRRTAKNFVRIVQENDLERHFSRIKALSISAAVLECVRSLDWNRTVVAQAPDKDHMTKALLEMKD